MQRRKFIHNSGLTAIAVGVFGNISWSKDRFTGDTPTTTDILGPFYRPGAPFRTNINSKDYSGRLFHISGTIFKEDGKTPFKNCLIEIWQCDEHRVYDNITDEYKYRGAQRTGEDGKYYFIGMHPIPYPAAENSPIWRPAHIHLLISGEGQQDLITQIYIEGDPHLKSDLGSSASQAVNRILKINSNANKEESILFDIVLRKEFIPDNTVFEILSGVYKMNDKSVMEFYRKEDMLIMKWNSQIREGLSYRGNNTFIGGVGESNTASFQLQTNNEVKVNVNFRTVTMGEFKLEGIKTFKYRD